MIVSFCIFAYNEEKYLPTLLKQVKDQDYSTKKIELLLIDSASTDRTKSIMLDFARRNKKKFYNIRVFNNPKKIQSCAWNIAIKTFCGDALVHVDAHAEIPLNFVSKNVEALLSGEDACGGPRPNISDEKTAWKDTLLLAEKSMFGSGIAPYRRKSGKVKEVSSLFHGIYRREIFDKVGLFNERLKRTEDNEMNYRIRNAGYKLKYHEDIISFEHIRPNLLKMMKQKFGNGYWVAITKGVEPNCISWFHLVPATFTASLIACISLYKISGGCELSRKLLKSLCTTYGMSAVLMAFFSSLSNKNERNITNVFLPLVFFLLHTSYGMGSLLGFLKLPSFKKSYYKK